MVYLDILIIVEYWNILLSLIDIYTGTTKNNYYCDVCVYYCCLMLCMLLLPCLYALFMMFSTTSMMLFVYIIESEVGTSALIERCYMLVP